MTTGFLQPYQSVVQVRKQVIAVLYSDWTLSCYNHNLKLMWSQKLNEKEIPISSEASLLVSAISIKKSPAGVILVGGRINGNYDNNNNNNDNIGGDSDKRRMRRGAEQEKMEHQKRPEAASIGKEVKSSSLGRELIKSIESDTKPEEVIILFEAGADPNATKYPSGEHPALIIAIKNDNIDIVKLLLEKGANPNATEYSFGGSPALIVAIEKNNIGIVDVLLEKGADPNIGFDTYKGTPLHHASKTGNADIIKLLITKGKADVNAVDNWNSTPMFNAVQSGSIEAVDILLTNGARTDVVDNYGNTPLLLAIEKGGSTEVIKLLITKGKADVTAACKKYRINPVLSRFKIAEVLITKMPKLYSAGQDRCDYSSEEENISLEPLELENVESRQTKTMSSSWLDRQEMSTSPMLYHCETSAELVHQTHESAPYRPQKTTALMLSSRPERKQLSAISTSLYDDELPAELTKESTYRLDKSSTAGQREGRKCDIL
ncbi:PREDICTED: ankycorbin-like [Amphimedon queenslandica]|uniref:Uncharacterized protein n=1 Tax=Amphimedon queenslandica TaxID=400682 RepID=A0AAN0J4H9_AMPQE|nr:PREDICTED: ankycorbin-like [Amphimedon queenslandica]|eukprot:XP_019851651.1 PREDICTED: ankycorbin-like [Amphimedon queenslandica]